MILIFTVFFFTSPRKLDSGIFHREPQVPSHLESPFSQYCPEYVPRYHSAALSQQNSSYSSYASPSPTSFNRQELSHPSLSPLNFTSPLPENNSIPSDIFPLEIGQESSSQVPNVPWQIRKTRVMKSDQALKILRQLQAAKLTATDLLIYVIEGQDGFEGFQNAFFSPKNRASLLNLLSLISNHEKGNPIFENWVEPRAIQIVCEKVHKEMEAAKPDLRMSTKEVTPEFIAGWDINTLMEPIAQNITPTLTAVLVAATESKESSFKEKGSRSRNRTTVGD